MVQWWIRIRGRVMGPLTSRELKDRLNSGEIQLYHECSSDGVTWVTVADISEFSPSERKRKPTGKPLPAEEPAAESQTISRRRRDEIPSGSRFKLAKYIVIGMVIAGIVLLIAIIFVLLWYFSRQSNGVINLNRSSETEKTHLFESTVCFVVPGHIVTTSKGEELQGFMLPQEISKKEIKFSGGTGSGFVISNDGYILTNRHVIQNFSEYCKSAVLSEYKTAKNAKVTPQIWVFFGKDDQHNASLVYESPELDFALLKIESTRASYFALCDTEPEKIPLLNGLKALGYPGKDSDAIDLKGAVNQVLRQEEGKQSDFLFQVVHRAFSDDQFKLSSRPGDVTKRPELKQMRPQQKESYVLRHNAQIFGGNSGGPLICKDGTVIGINTWSLNEPGISFALTLPQLRKTITQHVPKAVWRPHPE